ncbi:MAG: hypothetical protein R3268_00040 [Acidiferrobacterales bacterium]|nr:hypothetical protein [Acidiferrobacterales bacterium]
MQAILSSGAIYVTKLFYRYVAVAEKDGQIIRCISKDKYDAVRECRRRLEQP